MEVACDATEEPGDERFTRVCGSLQVTATNVLDRELGDGTVTFEISATDANQVYNANSDHG